MGEVNTDMSTADLYDLIVIGAGPGGYVAAERAGGLGKKTLLIEKSHLGGVCLNEGCIPSKTLLHSAKLFAQARRAGDYGVLVENPRFDLGKVMARKRKVVETLRKGIAYQMDSHHVEVLNGEASFSDRDALTVNGAMYKGRNVMIATGSSPIRLPIPGADKGHVLDSTQALEIAELPRSIVIIGGGIIGLEFASFFSSVGVGVAVIEMLPEILPSFDADIAAMLRKSLPEVTFYLNSKVISIGEKDVAFNTEGNEKKISADMVLMAVGRRPNTRNLGLEKIGVDFDPQGIKVDDKMRTNLPNLYAVGDVNGKSPLAHSASRMGEVAVNVMFGGRDRMRYHAIPSVVYTNPEVASAGLTEASAAYQGRKVKVTKLPMRANGRYLAENEGAGGICKVLTDVETGVLVGVHMLGPNCSEIVYGAAAMIEAELRVKDVKEIVFPHPTVSEIFKDALWEIQV
jgi:dihydrolipoamide dehydrogenase